MVLYKPDGTAAHLVREHALLDRLLDDRLIINDRPLHLIRQAQSHAPASRGCLVGCLANRLVTGAHCDMGTRLRTTPRPRGSAGALYSGRPLTRQGGVPMEIKAAVCRATHAPVEIE